MKDRELAMEKDEMGVGVNIRCARERDRVLV